MQVNEGAGPRNSWPTAKLAAAVEAGSKLNLTWADASTESVPLVWLRDNCVCNTCRIAATGEHRYFLGNVESRPGPRTVSLIQDLLRIEWTDGHTSEFRNVDLAALHQTASRRQYPARLWTQAFEPARFDHHAVLQDETTKLDCLQTLAVDGIVILTGAPTNGGQCATTIAGLGAPVRETPFDRVHDVFFHSDGYNVAHTDEALPPHTDFPSYQWPPSGQVLHMLTNETAGGESLVVDGWQVVDKLRDTDSDSFDVLTRVMVPFREHCDTAESWARAPLIRLDPDSAVTGFRFSNQLMQPLEPTHPDVEAFYHAYHRLAQALMDPRNQVTFRLEGGQMMLVHNHRVLHGRQAYNSAEGTRHLQDTYFEFDDIASEAARLGQEIQ